MDKKKVIELIKKGMLYQSKSSHVYSYKEKAKNCFDKALDELQKPTLDNYIQALPYLTLSEGKYGEGALKVTDNVWAYAPTLYKFEGKWLIDWVEGGDNDSGKVIEGSTPLEVAKNAYNYCVDRGFIKDTLNHG